MIPLITSCAARIAGVTVREYCTDGKAMARAHLAAWKRFSHDGLMVFSDVGMVAEALGSAYVSSEDSVPELEKPILTNIEAVSALKLPAGEIPGRWGVYYDAIEILFNSVSDRVPVLAFVPAPFTTAAGLRGTEDFLVDLIIDPEGAHQTLEKAAEGVRALLDGVMERGALPVLVDPLASGSVLSADQFSQFVLPYLQNEIKYLHRYDMDVILHICGRTTSILEHIVDSTTDLFSLDDTPLQEACDKLGDRVRIVGNIRPTKMLHSTPAEIADEVAGSLRIAKQAPKGFALSTGCEMPLDTPEENIDAFMETGRREGIIW